MLTYTKQRNTFGKLVNNSTDTNTLSLADDLCNTELQQVLSDKDWWFFEKSFTLTTQAATQFIKLPGDVDRIISDPYLTIGSYRYKPDECPSFNKWNEINTVTYTSDYSEWWYSYAGQLGLFPTPATAGNTITLNAKQRVREMSIADITAGTIATLATVGTTTTITGSGTTWADGMVGLWIKITSGTATKQGDGQWYQIGGVSSTTSLTLMNPYGGSALATASANYTIGQCSILPEAYQWLPLYRALNIYFTSIDADETKATLYGGKAGALLAQMEKDHSNRTGSRVLDDGNDEIIINPNLTVSSTG